MDAGQFSYNSLPERAEGIVKRKIDPTMAGTIVAANLPRTTPYAEDRLHPETLRTLRDLIKLHGAERLTRALAEIAREAK